MNEKRQKDGQRERQTVKTKPKWLLKPGISTGPSDLSRGWQHSLPDHRRHTLNIDFTILKDEDELGEAALLVLKMRFENRICFHDGVMASSGFFATRVHDKARHSF